MNLSDYQKVQNAHNYVQNNILFGYNIDDNIEASNVLDDGIGQCNTKGTLLMAFLRALNINCRVHGFYITKKLQYGAMTGLTYVLAPKKIFHSYVEVLIND